MTRASPERAGWCGQIAIIRECERCWLKRARGVAFCLHPSNKSAGCGSTALELADNGQVGISVDNRPSLSLPITMQIITGRFRMNPNTIHKRATDSLGAVGCGARELVVSSRGRPGSDPVVLTLAASNPA